MRELWGMVCTPASMCCLCNCVFSVLVGAVNVVQKLRQAFIKIMIFLQHPCGKISILHYSECIVYSETAVNAILWRGVSGTSVGTYPPLHSSPCKIGTVQSVQKTIKVPQPSKLPNSFYYSNWLKGSLFQHFK